MSILPCLRREVSRFLTNNRSRSFHGNSIWHCTSSDSEDKKFQLNDHDNKGNISDVERLVEFFKKAENEAKVAKARKVGEPRSKETKKPREQEKVMRRRPQNETGIRRRSSGGWPPPKARISEDRLVELRKAKSLSEHPHVYNIFGPIPRFSAEPAPPDTETFASMLRHDSFIGLGDPVHSVVAGHVFEVVNDDIYVDFGCKFHCVVDSSQYIEKDYVRGIKVAIRIQDLEMIDRFFQSDTYLTLREAQGSLLGRITEPPEKTSTLPPTESEGWEVSNEVNIESISDV